MKSQFLLDESETFAHFHVVCFLPASLCSAILDQLRLKAANSIQEKTESAAWPEDVRALRRAIGDFIEKEKDDFIFFLEEEQQTEAGNVKCTFEELRERSCLKSTDVGELSSEHIKFVY